MRLRTRLVVAFLILSVVPLGAVTYYSYTSQVRALRELASREADALSTDMTQRMKSVTTELSSRVEQLVDMTPVVTPRQAPPKASKPAVPAVNAVPVPVAAAETADASPLAATMTEARVSEALGAAAMLLRSVELQGMRRGGGSRPRGDDPRFAQSDPRSSDDGTRFPRTQPGEGRSGRGSREGRGPVPSPPLTSVGIPPAVATVGQTRPLASVAVTPVAPAAPAVLATPGVPGPPGAPPRMPVPSVTAAGADAGERIVIDMGAITREMYRKYVPEGVSTLTTEQRQQMARDINQRVMGIAEGIRLSATELQKKAQEAEEKAGPIATPTPPPPPPPPTTAPPTAPVTPAKVADAPAPKMTRTSTLVGNKLDVKVSQDGKVVSQANATIDLENVLATVFSPTRRERGEVAFAVGPDGHLYTATDADRKTVQDLGSVARPDGPLGKTVLPDWVVFTQTDPSGSGLRFGIARPV
ncbi:MAG: hypothetical protein ABIP90_06745, partial [Vicinamibacterales bacterium]